MNSRKGKDLKVKVYIYIHTDIYIYIYIYGKKGKFLLSVQGKKCQLWNIDQNDQPGK